ncbi:MAG: hypothetical protein LBU39_12115 [Desulfobulbaceae bacterium]|nr:hypothetical protein [Desulfobulbaceae bacterium]
MNAVILQVILQISADIYPDDRNKYLTNFQQCQTATTFFHDITIFSEKRIKMVKRDSGNSGMPNAR